LGRYSDWLGRSVRIPPARTLLLVRDNSTEESYPLELQRRSHMRNPSSLLCVRKEIRRHPCPNEYHEPTHPSLWQTQGVMGAEISTDDCPQNHDRGMRPKDSQSHNEQEHGNAVDRAT